MSLNWRQAVTSAIVAGLTALAAFALFNLLGVQGDYAKAVGIGLAIGAGRIVSSKSVA